MKTHIHEVSVGVDCGGDRKTPTVLFHGRGFPKFVHQNTLATFRTVGVSLIPASLHDPTVARCVFYTLHCVDACRFYISPPQSMNLTYAWR